MKHNFKNLNIWKLSINLAVNVYEETENFPKSEEFGLKSQLRRCAVSVPSNTAEGSSWTSNKDFNRFLEYSQGSLYEMQTQIIISTKRKFIPEESSENIENQITELQKMVSGFQKTLQ